MAATKQFMVLIQETRAKAEEACWLPVLIQQVAGKGLDVVVVLEVCKKAATTTTAVCKAADMMHKEVAAPTDPIQEGAMEDKAYRPPILIPTSTFGDFGSGMCGLTKRYLPLYLPATNVFLSCNEKCFQ